MRHDWKPAVRPGRPSHRLWTVRFHRALLDRVHDMNGCVGALKRSVGPGFTRFSDTRGSLLLGMLFGLNIPACATPLLIALLASSAASGARGGSAVQGFIALALFGLALSLPLI